MIEAFGNAFWSVNAASKIDGQREHIRSALEAALSTDANPVKTAPAVAVKALEWRNVDETWNDVWDCVTDLAEGYSISRWWLDDRRDEIGHFEVEELGEEQFGSLEEAQAAAQTHFGSRYAALSAQVQDVAGLLDDTWNTAVERAASIADDCVHLTPDPGAAIKTMLNGRVALTASPASKHGDEE